jgi:predicted ATPase/DNA-binding winged helix-turn-helix (wHTH) protein
VEGEGFLFGSFQLFPKQRLLLDNGRAVSLGSRALDILTSLIEEPGRTVSNAQMMARAWPTTTVDEGSLRVHIGALRKVLRDGHGGNRFIINNPGRGYTFVAPVTREAGERQADVPVTAPANANLPRPSASVIGRTDTIAALAAQFSRRRLLTIVGPGGIGKTTMAVALGAAVSDIHGDGVWFVGLASLPAPDLVASAVGAALGVAETGADPLPGVAAWLRNKRALIILDNCEHVVDAAAAAVETLLTAAPRVSIIATSREPLRASGESLHRLAPLGTPATQRRITAEQALKHPAVELFAERARACDSEFTLTDAIAPTVCEICHKLDGVPLAIELAAAQIGAFGVQGVAQLLDDRFSLLTRGHRTAPGRQRTLRATMDWSYELLPDVEKTILRRLAVFRGAFSMDAAVGVVSGSGLMANQVLSGIADLFDKSLVAVDISGNVAYYHLPETIRAYALQKLDESGEIGLVGRTHAHYFAALFRLADADAETRSREEWLSDYGPLIDNCRAALDWLFASDGDVATGLELTAMVTPLWVQMSLMSELRRFAERALGSLTQVASRDERIEMMLNAALGSSLTYTTGPVAETFAAWSRTLGLAERVADEDFRLRALRGLWSYHMNLGEYRESLARANQFCALAEQQAKPRTLRAGNRMVGLLLHYLGEQEEARKRVEWSVGDPAEQPQSTPTAQFMIDQSVAAQALLARILWLQGFPEQAMRLAERALEQAEDENHVISQCHALAQAACPVALWRGDLVAAERFVARLNELAAENLLGGWITRGKCFSCVLAILSGDASEGSTRLQSALQELPAAGSTAEYPAFMATLAHGLVRAGQIAAAQTTIDEAIRWSETTGERWCAAELLRVQGEILAISGDDGAEHALQRSLDVARAQGVLSWELRSATNLARLWQGGGRGDEARAMLAAVYERFSEGFETADLVMARALIDQLAP